MKRITTKIFGVLVLMFSVIFCGLSITSPFFSHNAYAVPVDLDQITPDNTNDIPETDNTPDNADDKPNEADDTDSPDSPDTPDSPDDTKENKENDKDEDKDQDDAKKDAALANTCTEQAGSLSWIVCPTTNLIASIVDTIYGVINDLLIVQPLTMSDGSPIYIIWQYVLNLTNIVFVIFLLIVIMSQVTGIGISNYGVKRILPNLIVAVIMMNLSFLICTLAVDASNIIGSSFRSFFQSIQDGMLSAISDANGGVITDLPSIGFETVITAVLGGGLIGGLAIGAAGGLGTIFWMLVPVLIGAVISVVTGLITIAARQALVALLVMIAPLAFAAYLLPNTGKWFEQWKSLFMRMLVFYPAFSFLYGASKLVGWALIASAKNGFGVVLGLAVQIFPLFFSWSLMKMSGTILGTLNNALRGIAKPAQNVGSRWALEHAEQNRQNYIGQNDNSAGARLRQYLDYRRSLRLNDTKNAAEIRQDRAIEHAMKTSASVLGRDEQGNMKWTVNPNRYARTAKSASYHHTMASNANAVYQNTLSGFGRHFTDNWSTRISYDHGEAFADSMAQRFLAANEAEADQKWLLDQYLNAKTNLNKNSYQYNRLIRDAAGGLGHNGESSIMGQVIIGNSTIENRRRSEARVMINKFGMEKHKRQLRGMIFDKQYINDNGFATDARGTEIEDDQYNLKDNYQYTPWQNYIGVHKVTGDEITKAQYDSLSDTDRAQYNKVRYFDITNDKGDDVQRVFEDDAGYMKEILADDIAIADPINRRYLIEIGVAKKPGERDGIIRRYHSTIRTALDSTGFKDHAAGVTAMLTSSANFGNLREIGHYNIGLLQSLAVAAKPGSFLKNDKFFIEEVNKLVQSFSDPEKFKHYFPDSAVNSAVTNNGIPIDGLQVVIDKETGEKYWDTINYQDLAEIERTDPAKALEARKNFIKHNYMARAFSSLVGFLNREMTPDSLASLKPGAMPALKDLLNSLKEVGMKSLDPNTAFEDRIKDDPDKGNLNIFGVPDGHDLKLGVQATQDEILRMYDIVSNAQRQNNDNKKQKSSNNSRRRRSQSSDGNPPNTAVDDLLDALERAMEYRQRNNAEAIANSIQSSFSTARQAKSLSLLLSDLQSTFSEFESLRQDDIAQEFQNIIQQFQYPPHAQSTEEAEAQITDPYNTYEKDYIDQLEPLIRQLIDRANTK